MRYEGVVYRPPSEAYSLIIQVTIGCAHNKCTFCSMYKGKTFRVRPIEEVFQDLETARRSYKHVKRIFLADGDALVLRTEDLKKILLKIRELFPECERVGVYAAPKDILRKDIEGLIQLRQLGLGIVYMGIESGSDEILKDIKKGCTSEEIVKAGRKIVESNLKLSVTLISGIGGEEKSHIHAVESARVISEINPDYVGLLTLMVEPQTEIYDKVKSGELKLLNPEEIMFETYKFVKNLNVDNCVFRSNHASNYAPLGAVLCKEKDILLKEIEGFLKGENRFRSEFMRGL